ncbi:MAG TPA: hypothetical protein PK246_10240, partial [Saprospiraceae bacterium]|nr:hypothetical protein [Saprospiraceae bacterium]
MRILFIFLFCIGQIAIIEAQQEDNVWMFGGGFGLKDYDGTWGVSYVDFNNEPPDIYFVKEVKLNILGTNAEICDYNGKLRLYTNGMSIANGQHDFVADTINYGDEWEIHKDFKNDTLIYHDGMIPIQGAMILPDPADSLRYYVLYTQFQRGQNWWEDYIKGLYYSHVDMRLNDGRGGLLSRDVPMVEDSLGWGGLS